MQEEIFLEPDPARVMEGLRDTGYDFNTAMADLVDNSIAADASVVKVNIDMDPKGEIVVYIADNGHGMNMDGLKNAMKYGSAERVDPSSLGKFGLGLKTASTAFCRCLSLVSKGDDNEYRKVRWDLDEIIKINKWKLLQPKITDDEIDILESITNGETGTLVIWEKIDRLMKQYKQDSARLRAYNKLITKLKEHFAMVYERFLDVNFEAAKNIEIYVNNQRVEPWDPYCKSEPNTRCLAKEDMQVEYEDGNTTSFLVEAWLLPQVNNFSSPEAHKNARVNNDMQGFYVYRENRLIFHGNWLGMFVNDPHYSLLRVNFSFDHRLDEAFNVDIKKSKIVVNDEIYAHLHKEFLPAPRREANEVYRKGKTAKVKKAASEAHDASNVNIDKKAASVEGAKVDIIDQEKGTVQIHNSQGVFKGTLRIKTSNKPGQCRVIPVESIDSGLLWEPGIVDENHAVMINQSHDYYNKVYAPVIDNNVLITGMDALLWALAEAEVSTYNDQTREQYEEMRYRVSRILKRLVDDLPEPNLDDEGDE